MSSYLIFSKIDNKGFFYIINKNGDTMIDSQRKTIQVFESKHDAEIKLKKYLIQKLKSGVYTFEGKEYVSNYNFYYKKEQYLRMTSELRAKIIEKMLLDYKIIQLME